MLIPHLHIRVFNKKISAFHFFGIIGYIASNLLGVILCYYSHLHIGTGLLLSLTGALTFFLLAILAKIITGEEVIVYYHHEIAILVTCVIVLKLLHAPILSYLDITILGIATFLAFGRIGCFNVGCCHGKPAGKGVVYHHEHVESGFTFYYEGVPLFPVQLLESGFVFLVVIAGSIILLGHSSPGTVLIFYTAVYGTFRFFIEFIRGDSERPYFKGLSEAQWTTLLLMALSVIFAFVGFLPLFSWHLLAASLIFLASVITVVYNRTTSRLMNPRHIRQIAMALDRTHPDSSIVQDRRNLPKSIDIFHTDLVHLSMGQLMQDGTLVRHYTVSCTKNNFLTYTLIRKLATVIQQIQKHSQSFEIYEKQNAVFHILFRN